MTDEVYQYHTITRHLYTAPDGVTLTPEQERAVLKKLNEAIERSIMLVAYGGYAPADWASQPATVEVPKKRNPFGIIQFEDAG